MRKRKILIYLFAGVFSLITCISLIHIINRHNNNRSVAFEVKGDSFQIYKNGQWQNFLIKGVNLGASKPGFFPGEMSITRKEYTRWLKLMGSMNANVIRVYTLLSPDFYQAFFEYNLRTDKPLYLLQGIWIDDNNIANYGQAYSEKLSSDFHTEIMRIIDVIHGNAVLEPRTGHASGSYRFDVSSYVMGFILCEEMDAEYVINTNERNAHITGYDGYYLYTESATPYEAWLASAGDYAITYEQNKYGGASRPISWTNWPTTDPMEHPNEPDKLIEDAVGVDVEHIKARTNFNAGIFASYHVYPFYPDFMRFQPEYTSYVDDRGKLDTYEAYLRELKAHHTMPVVIAEFGVPSSRGINRRNHVLPYNQGNLTEKAHGEALADMFDSIIKAGFAGGVVFAWQDEWFKRTWNSMFMDIPERRAYWSNYMVSEQSYGLLSFDPGAKTTICQVDGNISEWKWKRPIYSSDGLELSAMSDERYMYLLLKDKKEDVERTKYCIGADIVNSLGSRTWTEEGITFSRSADVIIVINGQNDSTVLIEASEDTFYRYYSLLDIVPRDPRFEVNNSGIFSPWRLIMCRDTFLPQTREYIPLEYFDAGKLLHGNSNPNSPNYTNLADFFISSRDRAIELRIPWMLLKAADPSTRMFIGDLYSSGSFNNNPVKIDGIYFEPLRITEDRKPDGAGDAENEKKAAPGFYTWNTWADSPSYHERLKASYTIMQKKFAEY